MIIKIKWSKAHSYSYFLIQKYYFHSFFNARIPKSCFPNSFFEDHMNMSFHWNQMEDIVANLLLKMFQMEQNGMFLENFEYDHYILHKN